MSAKLDTPEASSHEVFTDPQRDPGALVRPLGSETLSAIEEAVTLWKRFEEDGEFNDHWSRPSPQDSSAPTVDSTTSEPALKDKLSALTVDYGFGKIRVKDMKPGSTYDTNTNLAKMAIESNLLSKTTRRPVSNASSVFGIGAAQSLGMREEELEEQMLSYLRGDGREPLFSEMMSTALEPDVEVFGDWLPRQYVASLASKDWASSISDSAVDAEAPGNVAANTKTRGLHTLTDIKLDERLLSYLSSGSATNTGHSFHQTVKELEAFLSEWSKAASDSRMSGNALC